MILSCVFNAYMAAGSRVARVNFLRTVSREIRQAAVEWGRCFTLTSDPTADLWINRSPCAAGYRRRALGFDNVRFGY